VPNKQLKNDLAEDLKDEIASSDYELMPKGHKHYNPNKNKSNAPFVQQITDNIQQMYRYQDLLKDKFGFSEKHWYYVLKLSQYLEWNTNALIAQERSKYKYEPAKELTITDISALFDKSRSYISGLINKVFIPAGIIFQVYVDSEQLKNHGRNVEKRMLFMNPELFVKGGAGEINPVLFKPLKYNDRLEQAGVKLYWKLWHNEGEKWAKLINREVYRRRKKRLNR
jgi:hypothetical protein